MDNRKRARLEAPPPPPPNEVNTALPLATLDGQSIFLSNSSLIDQVGAQLPANVFLTICDEQEPNSDDAEEDDDDAEEATTFLTIDSSNLAALALPHQQQQHRIKRELLEQEMGTQTTPPPQQVQAPPLQYRLVQPHQLASMARQHAATESASLVTLPSGCEIYLVKEYATSAADADEMTSAPASAPLPAAAAIKMEPGVQFAHGGAGGGELELGGGSVPQRPPKVTLPAAVAPAVQPSEELGGGSRKRSFILEAYKKRDDKRRATHNEVERRRRDKINSWIFKLKEMLPPEMPSPSCAPAATNCDSAPAAAPVNACGSQQQQQQQKVNVSINNNISNNNNSNSRTPPSDSKSQILIKACEYIKAMQQEIKSLRECLTENEHLRLSNQRLQTELHKWKTERTHSQHQRPPVQQQQFNVVTLNSLNGSGLFGVVNSVATATGAATLVATAAGSNGSRSLAAQHTTAPAYAKRELIIRDYVD